MTDIHGNPLFTWLNLVVFLACVILPWMAINFRLWVIFNLPHRKRDKKLAERRRQKQ